MGLVRIYTRESAQKGGAARVGWYLVDNPRGSLVAPSEVGECFESARRYDRKGCIGCGRKSAFSHSSRRRIGPGSTLVVSRLWTPSLRDSAMTRESVAGGGAGAVQLDPPPGTQTTYFSSVRRGCSLDFFLGGFWDSPSGGRHPHHLRGTGPHRRGLLYGRGRHCRTRWRISVL